MNEKKKVPIKSISVCLLSAVTGSVCVIGLVCFYSFSIISIFHESSKYPYYTYFSIVSIYVCIASFIVLTYLWTSSFLNQTKKIQAIILSIVFYIFGFVAGVPIFSLIVGAVENYKFYWESKDLEVPLYGFTRMLLRQDRVSIFGLLMVVLLLIPNIIFAFKAQNPKNKCINKLMNIIEQIGRYSCMFLMILILDFAEFGYISSLEYFVYYFGNFGLMTLYWLIWALYFKKPVYWKQLALAIIPTALFLMSGVTTHNILLIVFSILFGVGHIYVTNKNRL